MKRSGAARYRHYLRTRKAQPIFRIKCTAFRPSINDQKIAQVMQTLVAFEWEKSREKYEKALTDALIYGTGQTEYLL